MSVQEKFLGLYREYESLLRAAGKDPRTEEEEMAEPDAGRMRMCRQARNYLVHASDPGFAGVTEKMLAFMQKKVDGLKEEGDVARKHLKKPAACMLTEDMKAGEAFLMFQKLKVPELVVCKKDGSYGKLSVYSLPGCRANQKVGSLHAADASPVFCSPLDTYDLLDPCSTCLCTDDGTAGGRLIGQVWFKNGR